MVIHNWTGIHEDQLVEPMEQGLSEIIEHDGFDVVSGFGSLLAGICWSWEDRLDIIARCTCSSWASVTDHGLKQDLGLGGSWIRSTAVICMC